MYIFDERLIINNIAYVRGSQLNNILVLWKIYLSVWCSLLLGISTNNPCSVTLGYVQLDLSNIFGWVRSSPNLTGQSRVPKESVTGSNDPNLLYIDIFPVHWTG